MLIQTEAPPLKELSLHETERHLAAAAIANDQTKDVPLMTKEAASILARLSKNNPQLVHTVMSTTDRLDITPQKHYH